MGCPSHSNPIRKRTAWQSGACAAVLMVMACQMPAVFAGAKDPSLPDQYVVRSLPDCVVQGGQHLMPATPATFIYKVVQGNIQDHQNTARFHLRIDDSDRDDPYQMQMDRPRLARYALQNDGAISLDSIVVQDRKLITQFHPALPRLPAEIKPGLNLRTHAHVKVVAAEHPDQVEHEGTITETLRWMGRVRLKTPAGVFDCVHLRAHAEADVDLAHVDTVTDSYYSPKVGLVARSYANDLSVLWVLNWNHRRLLLLQSHTADPPDDKK